MSLICLIYKWLLAIKLLIQGIKGSLRTQSSFPLFCEFAEGVGLNINEEDKAKLESAEIKAWNFTGKKKPESGCPHRVLRVPPKQCTQTHILSPHTRAIRNHSDTYTHT